jgi:hypothetical protein
MDGGISSISAIGNVRVRAVRFHSTHLKNISTSPAGGPPAAVGPLSSTAYVTFGQVRRRVLAKSVRCIGPTSVHNRYIDVSTLMHIKIYI